MDILLHNFSVTEQRASGWMTSLCKSYLNWISDLSYLTHSEEFKFQRKDDLKFRLNKCRIVFLSFSFKKWAILSLFLIYFQPFQANNTIFASNVCRKMSFQYPMPGFELTKFRYEFPPLTTRPVLLPIVFFLSLCLSFFLSFDVICIVNEEGVCQRQRQRQWEHRSNDWVHTLNVIKAADLQCDQIWQHFATLAIF